MRKKIVGILVVGLLMATMFPIGSSIAQPTEERHMNNLSSQIEIKIKGGFAIHAFVKNIGTTDLNDVNVHIVLDGSMIFPGYKDREATMDLKAGSKYFVIIPVRGFGATNIEITIDSTTETVSATVFGRIVFGVQ